MPLPFTNHISMNFLKTNRRSAEICSVKRDLIDRKYARSSRTISVVLILEFSSFEINFQIIGFIQHAWIVSTIKSKWTIQHYWSINDTVIPWKMERLTMLFILKIVIFFLHWNNNTQWNGISNRIWLCILSWKNLSGNSSIACGVHTFQWFWMNNAAYRVDKRAIQCSQS